MSLFIPPRIRNTSYLQPPTLSFVLASVFVVSACRPLCEYHKLMYISPSLLSTPIMFCTLLLCLIDNRSLLLLDLQRGLSPATLIHVPEMGWYLHQSRSFRRAEEGLANELDTVTV